jgi:MFS family permease
MTQATELLRSSRATGTRLVASISAAHFVSHYYILLLPPLFDSVRGDYGVSYTELGLALTIFNVTSALFQTSAGFLVDRFGARLPLIGGLLLGAGALAIAGIVNSFWVLIAMFALAGLGNTVYHPADYAILSHHVPPQRAARAFSIHTFAGMLGSALAPGASLLMQTQWGWRGAFIGAAVLGLAVALLLIVQGDEPPVVVSNDKSRGADAATLEGWRLLLSRPIMLNMIFFIMLALIGGGLQNYSIVALAALHGTAEATANAALTGYLALSAIGVLAGGLLATHTSRHGMVAAVSLVLMAVLAAVLVIDMSAALLIGVMAIGGFFFGLMMPSRDMLVRAVTPPGSFGKVFGFVTNGFNVGGIIAPVIFGLAMDHGAPQWVFLLAAAFSLLTILTLVGSRKRAV